MDSHSSRMLVTKHLVQPTRTTQCRNPPIASTMRCPYLALLRVGFTMPSLLPKTRCALTAPFHPYQHKVGGIFSVALSLGSPPADVIRHPIPVEPGLSSMHKTYTATIQSTYYVYYGVVSLKNKEKSGRLNIGLVLWQQLLYLLSGAALRVRFTIPGATPIF